MKGWKEVCEKKTGVAKNLVLQRYPAPPPPVYATYLKSYPLVAKCWHIRVAHIHILSIAFLKYIHIYISEFDDCKINDLPVTELINQLVLSL